MIWQDVIVNRKLTSDEVTWGICQLFSLESSEVLVVDTIYKAKRIGKRMKVICESRSISGEFCMLISIYLRDPKLARYSVRRTIGRFCEILNCTCLISDKSNNPYSMLLVHSCKDYKKVFLDVERLDNHGEYVVSRCQ